jgi:hypothetical protein
MQRLGTAPNPLLDIAPLVQSRANATLSFAPSQALSMALLLASFGEMGLNKPDRMAGADQSGELGADL